MATKTDLHHRIPTKVAELFKLLIQSPRCTAYSNTSSSFETKFQVERVLDPPLDEMVAAHLRGCWALAESDFIEAYKSVSSSG